MFQVLIHAYPVLESASMTGLIVKLFSVAIRIEDILPDRAILYPGRLLRQAAGRSCQDRRLHSSEVRTHEPGRNRLPGLLQ